MKPSFKRKMLSALVVSGALLFSGGMTVPAQADETCMSPYMAKIVGQEDYVYVWTLVHYPI